MNTTVTFLAQLVCVFVLAMAVHAALVVGYDWLATRWQERQRVSAYLHHQLAVQESEQMLADIETQQAQAIQRMYAAADRALSDIRACGGR
ncbi:hypothetical protein [Mycobacteroides abscessus]|uniref:hypothetical protein n=1 Tax=Mycobacteroides abscessus TaxID=36809 RepID=UPI000D9C3A85|nr:hypothetical protein [Mycobacteroides abscessus]SPX87808.1 Uncharacterised protein [Mycobacteroides abscessus]